MGNVIVIQVIKMLASLVLGSGIFDKILNEVTVWADKKIDGASKRQGVLDALEVAGLKLSKSALNLGIELAVTLITKKAG